MGKVRVLTGDLVSLISAGEVIESPASIVKELIENSLDAGATLIDIEIEEGGIKAITVSDNGSGILKDDCKVCLQRHSTSKIVKKEDLEEIVTYGFRGEALASIASVADVRITTQTADEETGTLIIARFGGRPTYLEVSRPVGTTVEVTDLFKNIPARRKHLSEARIESQKIQEMMMKHAVIRRDIGFRFRRNGETVIDCPPDQNARDRIASLWGIEIAKALVELDFIENRVAISGFVALPPVSRGNRSREYFSVAKRPIIDEKLSNAVEYAYSTRLMKGQFPICAVDISIDPRRVDVNVHPTKREVRILEMNEVCELIKKSVLKALGNTEVTEEPMSLEISIDELAKSSETSEQVFRFQDSGRTANNYGAILSIEQETLGTVIGDIDKVDEVEFLEGKFRIIGQIHNLYILLEFDEGLLIIDQHAAHERILYERLRSEVDDGTVAVQELLQPFVLNLSRNDAERILEMSDTLYEIGYTVGSFGGNDISISTLPEVFGRIASEKELLSLVDRFVDLGMQTARETFLDELVKVTACHSAIRSGQPLDIEQIRSLLIDMSKTKNMYNCCHGRPSMLRIMREDIDRKVGRLGHEAIARYKARHGLQ